MKLPSTSGTAATYSHRIWWKYSPLALKVKFNKNIGSFFQLNKIAFGLYHSPYFNEMKSNYLLMR